MHDYFEILGLPTDARAKDVRQALARRIRRVHPDFPDECGSPLSARMLALSLHSASPDAGLDFIDIATCLDRIQAAFFSSPS